MSKEGLSSFIGRFYLLMTISIHKRMLLGFFLLIVMVAGCAPTHSPIDTLSGASHLLQMGRKDLALKEIDRCLSDSPSNLYTYETAYELLRESGYPHDGLRYLERASKIRHSDTPEMKSDYSLLFTMLGDEYQSEKRLEDAERAYKTATELDETNATAYNDWGYMYADAGVKPDDAVQLTQKAVDLKPDTGEFLDSLGWALFQKGDVKKSFTTLRKAVELSPAQADIRYHLGMAEERAGDVKSAIVEYSKALSISPKHKQAADRLKAIRSKQLPSPLEGEG
jgi:Tfp pilus assembly protein PilF